jgi:hypothetical protein
MAITDKLAFWKKKKKEIDFDEPEIREVGPPPPGGLSFDEPVVQPHTDPIAPPSLVQPTPAPGSSPLEKDIQIISAKLDAIKSTLDVIVQRLDKLERNPPKW